MDLNGCKLLFFLAFFRSPLPRKCLSRLERGRSTLLGRSSLQIAKGCVTLRLPSLSWRVERINLEQDWKISHWPSCINITHDQRRREEAEGATLSCKWHNLWQFDGYEHKTWITIGKRIAFRSERLLSSSHKSFPCRYQTDDLLAK